MPLREASAVMTIFGRGRLSSGHAYGNRHCVAHIALSWADANSFLFIIFFRLVREYEEENFRWVLRILTGIQVK